MREVKKQIIYTIPKIAKKLETGKPLDELELIMAAATIRDWLRIKKSQTGRPPEYETEEDRIAARRATYAKANRKRREKKKLESTRKPKVY